MIIVTEKSSHTAPITSNQPTAWITAADLFSQDRWIVAIALVSALFALSRITVAPLWHDEVFTAYWISLDWLPMITAVMADNHLPLYPLILKAWSVIAGESDFALRFPSAVLQAISILVIGALGTTLGSIRIGRTAALLAMLSPYLLHHAQEARMYPLMLLLSSISTLLLVRYLLDLDRRIGSFFLSITTLLLLTHYYSLFFVAGQVLVLMILRKEPWGSWLPVASLCVVLMGTITLVALNFPNLIAGQTYAIGWLSFPGVIWAMIGGYSVLPSSEALHLEGVHATLSYLPIALAIAPLICTLILTSITQLEMRYRWLFGIVTLSVLIGPFAAHALIPSLSVNPRYFICAMPILLVWTAIGIHSRSWTLGVGIVLMAFAASVSAIHLIDPGRKRADIETAHAWIEAHVPAELPLLVASSEMFDLVEYHWKDRTLLLYPPRKLEVTAANLETFLDTLPERDADRRYYVFGRIWTADPKMIYRKALAQRYDNCGIQSFRGVDVWCLQKKRTTD